jgi:hypothetical protein
MPAPPTSYRPSALEVGPNADAGAVMIASSLQLAADLPGGEERDALVARARESAAHLLGGGVLAESWLDPIGCGSPTGPLRALAQWLNVRDHIPLGTHIVESLLLMSEPGSLEQGRILMQLASQAGLSGHGDMLAEHSRVIFTLGRRLHSDELLYKAWVQQNSHRYQRGNIPAWGAAVRRVVKYAERMGDSRLMALALNMRMTLLGQYGKLDQALAEGWRGVEMCDHPAVRERLLVNIGEALKRAGDYRAARAAAAALLRTPLEPSVMAAVLGSYSESSAGLDDPAGVQWATEQLLARTADPTRLSRGFAMGLMSCADACGLAGLDALAEKAFSRSKAMAEAKGYHDLRLRTMHKARAATRDVAHPFSGFAEQARRSIVDLAPDGVPLTLVLAER